MAELEIHEETSPRPEVRLVTDELDYRLRQQRIAAEFGYFALKSEDLGDLLQEATRLAAAGVDVAHAKYLQHIGSGAGFIVAAGVGWKPGVVGQATVGDDMESPAGYAYHTGKAVISNHLANEERFRTPTLLVEHGIRRALNVIIQTDRARYGVLEVDTPSEGHFDEADVAFLESFASILGVAIQREERDEAVREALKHQEVLTLEASHRVKNSLSVVAGLLSIQARMSADAGVTQALRDAGRRVQTVAAVHDRLWRTSAAKSVNANDFLKELCEQLAASTDGIEICCRGVDLAIRTDQAVTISLLVNELVTNAIKYAFPDQRGTVTVSLDAVDAGILRLTVEDRGKGLPENFDASGTKSLGVKLITSLSKQLGGEPEWVLISPGTRFSVTVIPAVEE
ncbi:GAF domain-containing protein [Rhizobium sp. XQZ8]|uniref:sensor histidine kinase n=1 Tax=Rhizobium populisoli TaxID=2859785 RepID=UPI001CA5D7E5|nr:histidine kinase dimerization/phosphoacceptor domain -containing protein [Rhizobium populisoli]MBW6426024.1 GAF domain-containing protein [Rhizobium populisoli]